MGVGMRAVWIFPWDLPLPGSIPGMARRVRNGMGGENVEPRVAEDGNCGDQRGAVRGLGEKGESRPMSISTSSPSSAIGDEGGMLWM